MSSSTKREVSHDPKEIEQRQRRSSRLIRKLLGSRSKKSSTSTEAKMPKIVNQLHLQKSRSLKHSTVLTKVALRSLKVVKIVKTVTIKVHQRKLKCLR
jgi:hypothetical protein